MFHDKSIVLEEKEQILMSSLCHMWLGSFTFPSFNYHCPQYQNVLYFLTIKYDL